MILSSIEDSKDLIKTIVEYYEMLKPLIMSRYESEMKHIKSSIEDLSNKKNKIISMSSEDNEYEINKTIKKSFDIFAMVFEFNKSIKDICDFYRQPYLNSENIDESNLSQTYKLETADFLNDLITKYYLFEKKYNKDLHTTLNTISEKILSTPHTLDLVKECRENFRKNLNTTLLYANITQNIIDKCDTNMMYKIMDFLEDDKDFIIQHIRESDFYEKKDKRKIPKNNPPFRKFGLIPFTDLMQIDDLIELLTGKKAKMKKLVSEYAFIIINSVSYHPVEYSVKKMLDFNLSKKYEQSEKYGISQKIIDRFSTIKQIYNKGKWDFSYEIIGKITEDKQIFAIETLDGVNYRSMGYPGFARLPFNVAKNMENFINGESGVMRLSVINKTQERTALKNMFLPRPLDMEDIEKKSFEIDTQGIKNSLFINIHTAIKEIIKKEFKNKITSMTDIADIVHDSRIGDIYSSILIKMYKTGYNQNNSEFNGGNFPFSEILSTYLLDLRDSTRQFMKEMHDNFPKYFKNKNLSEINEVHDIFENMIKDMINVQIGEKENIYSAITYKYLALNYV